MNVAEVPVELLREAPWNPNVMDGAMLGRLKQSMDQFGVVQNLVARILDDGTYEILSGND